MKVFKESMLDSNSVLIIAGGYDKVVSENVEYLKVFNPDSIVIIEAIILFDSCEFHVSM